MIRLSYISSVEHELSTEELLLLLQTCLENNQRDGLTGLLLYGNDTFLQTLEGDEKTIDNVYEKIQADPRHQNVKLLTRETIEARKYADWNMGFKRVSDDDLAHVSGLIDFSEKKFTFDYLAGHAEEARQLMDHFSSWDPLVRKIEEGEQTVKHLKAMLAQARGCVEIAVFVLESVTAASKSGPIGHELIRVCDIALTALRHVPEMTSDARVNALS